MTEKDWLTKQFEQNRGHLRGIAYRMLGSLSEAEDAVQETWMRLNRSDANSIDNLGGWLTTVVSRVCLDMLRSRSSRREDSIDENPIEIRAKDEASIDPEQEAILAESVGIALMVLLNRLTPAERFAFVLHDLMDLPFDEIAPILGRTSTATRQLASRARRQVRGVSPDAGIDFAQQQEVVNSFLTALRAGDIEALVQVLDPGLVVHIDKSAAATGVPVEIHGARNWARNAVAFARHLRFLQPALVDGAVGILLAPRGRLFRVLRFTFTDSRITQLDVIADPERLQQLEIGMLEGLGG
ncbi:sigma-70 family RNA polymerase sigma factor [Terriglobus albidus]|uniref:sigma-70 family RNA polymerase sigma factor n=1 Tax=Terriglobus albidus TaxID=1592106 RepID=UPI0021E01112|nr:sigma-70 family RNA polymerase sigma factor [Terriglobus albidus]